MDKVAFTTLMAINIFILYSLVGAKNADIVFYDLGVLLVVCCICTLSLLFVHYVICLIKFRHAIKKYPKLTADSLNECFWEFPFTRLSDIVRKPAWLIGGGVLTLFLYQDFYQWYIIITTGEMVESTYVVAHGVKLLFWLIFANIIFFWYQCVVLKQKKYE